MRFRITARPRSRIARIPTHYNDLVQGYLYKVFERPCPELHDYGYKYGNRSFRHFTFSRVIPKPFKRDQNHLLVTETLEFHASFLMDPQLNAIVRHLIHDQTMRLGNEEFEIVDVAAQTDPLPFNGQDHWELKIQALSPIVAYRTEDRQGKNYTHYFEPTDTEFASLVQDNAFRKYASLHSDMMPEQEDFSISPIRVDTKRDFSLVKFKGYIIKGYMGTYRLRASSSLLGILYHSGIGAKNPQGFGMFQVVDAKPV